MPATREVRCEACGKLNRVPSYSFRRIPSCGNPECGARLSESGGIKLLRNVYSLRAAWPIIPVGAVIAWTVLSPGSSKVNDAPRPYVQSLPAPDLCANRTQPREGVYRWYGPAWGQDVAELTIRTAPGANYFVKLDDMTNRPARAYYLYGGSSQTFPVPLGTFSLKYASGQSWCSESELFGDNTSTNVTDNTFTFKDDGSSITHWTVELIQQRNGNLGIHAIPRAQF